MNHKVTANITIGLELSPTTCKAALLSLRRGRPKLEAIFEVLLEREANVNPLYIECDPAQRRRLDRALTVSALASSEVLTRPLELKLTRARDIASVIKFQAEPVIPYPLQEAIVEWQKVGQTEQSTLVTILAARKDRIEEHLTSLQKQSIDPEVVSCVPAALSAFALHFCPVEPPVMVVHIGWQQTTCAMIKKGGLFSSFAIKEGVETFVKALKKDLNLSNEEALDSLYRVLDFSDLNDKNVPTLVSVHQAFQNQITRVIYAINKTTKKLCSKGEEAPLFVVGDGSLIHHLASELADSVDKELLSLHPSTMFQEKESSLQCFAVPIGLALSCLNGRFDPINFRQEELRYPHPWKHLTKLLFSFTALSITVTALLLLLGNWWAVRQQDMLREDFIKLLEAVDMPAIKFEAEYYSKKHPRLTRTNDLSLSLQKLTRSQILDRLHYLDQQIRAAPQTFALYPKTPRVSDVLAWLAMHPQVTHIDSETGEKFAFIEFESFSYTMVKRPDESHKKEKYRVKVEIEFSAAAPSDARQFHDALIAPNDFIDPKEEVKWSSARGRYRAAFFLKDKTTYPTSQQGAF